MSGLFLEVINMLVKFEARIVLTFLWSYEQNEAFNVQIFLDHVTLATSPLLLSLQTCAWWWSRRIDSTPAVEGDNPLSRLYPRWEEGYPSSPPQTSPPRRLRPSTPRRFRYLDLGL